GEPADEPAKSLSIVDPVLWLATLAVGHGDNRAATLFQQPENFLHCSCVPIFIADFVVESYVLDGAYAYHLIKDPVSKSCGSCVHQSIATLCQINPKYLPLASKLPDRLCKSRACRPDIEYVCPFERRY